MNAAAIILMLQLTLLGGSGPGDIQTVDQGLTQLRQAFPDWEASYIKDEWDCSEMSAFVCDYLKACGFAAEIKNGSCWSPGNMYAHSWVVCEGRLIESTSLSFGSPGKAFYKRMATTIYLGDMSTEYDWWNSAYIRNNLPAAADSEQNQKRFF